MEETAKKETEIELTSGQQKAVDMVGELAASKQPTYGILCGYAGTGKTTLLKQIARQFGDIVVVTPTGKAAVRVGQATNLHASTIHRWLYKVVEDRDTGAVRWVARQPLELARPASGLLVVDEASMMTDTVWDDLWQVCQAIDVRILLVGDPFQLPPVKPRDKEFSALALPTPHKTDLTEVVRQALDNPIIRASMLIRKSSADALDALDLVPTIRESALIDRFLEMPPASRALLAWTNRTRQRLNGEVRARLGMKPDVLGAGEPLLVTVNNYNLDRYNGEVVSFDGWVIEPKEQEAVKDFYSGAAAMVSFGVGTVEGEVVMLSPEEVLAKVPPELSARAITKSARWYARGVMKYQKGTEPSHLNADLGYCLTAHKAQGSEYDSVVVVVEPGRNLQSYEGRRWWYTAITRSRSDVSLCFVD